ncbi:RNA-directed DNA polymerase, eukaryota [Artemisia annua]|uniref:RNA-directed DNA polymerase, eukaryota n=1 Tax=Artemisia annua TaxID=35608 RepID=A0A2U1KJS7_ARTAN|nr:RNA-directed DNA polymerase, eukaryota [Artemisia annua]
MSARYGNAEAGDMLSWRCIGRRNHTDFVALSFAFLVELWQKQTLYKNSDRMPIRRLWGRGRVEHVAVDSCGRSGGLLCMWDPNVFEMTSSISDRNFILVHGILKGCGTKLNVINVYSPQGLPEKRDLWNSILGFVTSSEGLKVVMGDFNEVRCPEERLGSGFCASSARVFNEFIYEASLKEYRMGGSRFTYSGGCGRNFSKLDHVFVCDGFWAKWPAASLMAHPKRWSDHCPVSLKTTTYDFGPGPFRFYTSWLDIPSINEVVEKVVGDNKVTEDREVEDLLNSCDQWEAKAELGLITDGEIELWATAHAKWQEIENRKAMDIKQKSRVKWALDRDENSSFFHRMCKIHISNNRINGLPINGLWETRPNHIKKEVMRFYREKFKVQRPSKPCIIFEDDGMAAMDEGQFSSNVSVLRTSHLTFPNMDTLLENWQNYA